jgi:Asp-tRNA(Asn)/Glu-tRNA(Gln) amidotransferase A subunit family amidase
MTDLIRLTIAEARDEMKKGAFSSIELTDAYLAAIEAANPAINAYVKVTADKARDMAKASDARRAGGTAGALEGIPLGVKDLYATQGVHTQACSHCSTASSRATNPPSPPISGPMAQSCSASSTWTSSPWARPTRPPITAR